jgi:hypothetical protein
MLRQGRPLKEGKPENNRRRRTWDQLKPSYNFTVKVYFLENWKATWLILIVFIFQFILTYVQHVVAFYHPSMVLAFRVPFTFYRKTKQKGESRNKTTGDLQPMRKR